ncbi:sugar phosphate isomerase/epimerase [Brucella oryzae]|uniref:sugar phosphate isomerase/epimerase family protein n=1 Tax=Brucella oryzae TaxID=335286 RepID=UPI001B81A4E5|nr:sugar phosphate isomerase/epimerase family protein [Brucella oryzae]MBR7654308.1 sugar phosphate isomerase/epimerase [Brucella oryzae]
MKLAYMYATPEVAPAHVTAIQGDAPACFARIRELGYDGVELLVRDPRALDHALIERQLADAGLAMPAICTGEVYGEDKLSLADPDQARRAETLERMIAAMDLAARFGAMVNVGRMRGRYLDGIARAQTEAWVTEGMQAAADARPDTRIVLEPVNHQYANFLMGTAEAASFVRSLQRANIGLMLDLAHITIEGETHRDSLAAAGDLFWHYHVCDSDRKAVGDGSWDITAALNDLAAISYDGWITAEHFQVPDAETAMARSISWLNGHYNKH